MSNHSDKKRIIKHYNTKWRDFERLIHSDETLGIHLGFYEKGIKTIDEASINMNEYVGKLLELEKNKTKNRRILDAGCGVGGTSIYLAKKYPNYTFIGISIVSEQIRHAKHFAQRNDVNTNTEFIIKDFCRTDFKDKSFDDVFALESSCYSKSKKEFINEVSRIIKPDGRFVIIDGFLMKNITNYFANEAYRYYCDLFSVENFAEINNFIINLKESGFNNIEVKDITRYVLLFLLIGSLKGLGNYIKCIMKNEHNESSRYKSPLKYMILKIFSPLIILLSRKFRYLSISCNKV